MSHSSTKKTYSIILISSLLFGAVLAGILLKTTELDHFEQLHRVGEERLNLYSSTVEAEHKRFDYLPFIVAQDRQVLQLLTRPNAGVIEQEVNHKLELWQRESGADTLYLMNRQGVVVASSNWNQPGSFMGNDYHFRPYFQDAILGLTGQFFAIGVTTGQPGLFLSRPILLNNTIVGVAVLKINMSILEANWNAGGEDVWVSDSDGVIFLSSNPEWRYRSLNSLSEDVLERLNQAQKYSHHRIEALDFAEHASSPQQNRIIQLKDSAADIDGSREVNAYMLHHREIADLGWSLYYLSDLKGLGEKKTSALLISTLLTALIAVVGLFLFSRLRHQQLLEWRVTKRTEELNQSNTQLKKEIDERIKTEKALRQTHEELIQAEKLGALGQISAELVHEVSQPLQATLTFLASTKLLIDRGEYGLARENLLEIDKLIGRVSGIITHLKTFASKSRGVLSNVDLRRVIDNALLVLHSRIDNSGIVLVWMPPKTSLLVRADEIKLEQILVNLLRNAIDAIQSNQHQAHTANKQGCIEIGLSAENSKALITISDNGCGIEPQNLSKLFDPFFTTKPAGEGMGLGLSVSYGIVEEFGGRLEVESILDEGTTFSVMLSLSKLETKNDQQ